MIIPNIWKNKIHVPNHQPAGVLKIHCAGFSFSNAPPDGPAVARRQPSTPEGPAPK